MQNDTQKNFKEKIQETINALKANSKDEHITDRLISDLLSYKGQLEHEPTLLHLPLRDVADTFEGDTFRMQIMKDGTALYHVKGGMDIVASPRMVSLNGTIRSLIEDSKRYKKMSDEEREAFDTELQASSYVMNIPLFAFSDIDFMFDTASSVIKFLSSQFESEMSKPLQEETPEEDREFEDATKALEQVKKELKEESEDE